MSTQNFNLPDVGEGLTEAEIVAWKVAPGDTVAINDVICEIETAKSLVELPSPHAGVVGELLVAEGATVEVGAPIITFMTDARDDAGPGVVTTAEAPRAGRGRRLGARRLRHGPVVPPRAASARPSARSAPRWA